MIDFELTPDEMRMIEAHRAVTAARCDNNPMLQAAREEICLQIARDYEQHAVDRVKNDKSVNAAFNAAHFRAIAEGARLCAAEFKKLAQ